VLLNQNFIEIEMSQNKNKIVQIGPQGSLAVLALGSVGLKKWREAVREAQEKEAQSKKKDGEETGK
jgi:hypothetical protein